MNWPLLQNSLLLAGTATALALGFGLFAALWLATLESHWRNVFLAIAIAALALPPFLVTNCWISLLGETGTLRAWLPFKIYSLGGTIWILALLLWPITSFAILAAWRRLEAAQFECEPAMTGLALLRWLLIPAAAGELALAALLTFVLALNNFAVPAILQTKVLPDEMWVQFNTQFDAIGALKLSVPLVIVPVILLVWVSRQGVPWPRVQGSVSARVFIRQLGPAWRVGSGILTILVCGLSVALPLAQIASPKRTWAELAGAIEASTGTIWNSFWFAALAATVVTGAALVINRGGAETRRGKSSQRRLMSTAAAASWLPFFIPGVLIGIALIKVFNRPVLVAFYQSIGICLLALVIRYFALAWTAVRHALGSLDSDLADVAQLEGATRWQMFRFVVWPQIAPQMFAAWYVVYLLCLWDVESIVLVQPPGGETLALKVFNLLHYGYAAQVNSLCLVLVALAIAPLAAWGLWRAVLRQPSPHAPLSLRSSAAVVMACVVMGCAPDSTSSEGQLHSRLFERAIVVGSRGVGLGEFNKPRSVACDRKGNAYAVDMTGRVQKFSPEGRYLFSWQMPQTDLGKPKGMGRDLDGNIIVVEPHYQRVNHFTPEGKLVAQWGCRGTNEGCFMLPRGIAENSHGEFFVSEYMGAERVQGFLMNTSGLATIDLAQSDSAVRNRATATNWPYAKTDAPLSPEFSLPMRPVKLRHVIGRAGTQPGEFNRAEGICVDQQDRIYVADSCNHRIQIFSPDGKLVRGYGKAGSGLGELSYPYDIAVDEQGYQFVCEFGNSRIQVFDANCQPVEIIGGPGKEPGRFANPWGVALDAHGNLWVADAINHRLQKLVRRSPEATGLTRPLAQAKDGVRLPGSAAPN